MMRSQNLKLKKLESVRRIMLEILNKIIESKSFKNAARKTGNVVKITLSVYFIPIIISVALIPVIHEWFFILAIVMLFSTYPFSKWLIKLLEEGEIIMFYSVNVYFDGE